MQKPGPDGAAGTARPLSVAPAQGERVDVSHQAEMEKAPRGRKAKEGEKRRKLPGVGSWPNAETLAGKGSGYQPPTAALLWGQIVRGGVFVSRQAVVMG